MDRPSCCQRGWTWWERFLAAVLRRPLPLFDYGEWQEPPPDIGVREPRRPRPSSGSGSALLDPPL